MKYIPVSSANPCGQIHYGVPVIYNARQYVTRVDWMINQKNQLYGRYLQDNYDQPAPFSTDQLSSTPPRSGVDPDARRPSCWAIPTRSIPAL